MKLIHTISSLDKNSGGTSAYLQLLANELVKNISIGIISIQTKEPLLLDEKIKIFTFDKSFPWVQDYSLELKKQLNQVEANLFHGNGMWQFPIHEMINAAHKRNIPYILTPHGMLEPWALNAGKWKKKVGFMVIPI